MRKMLAGSHLFGLSFDCKRLSVTEEVRERAETLYNQWRAKVIAERRKSKRAARKARKRLALGKSAHRLLGPTGAAPRSHAYTPFRLDRDSLVR